MDSINYYDYNVSWWEEIATPSDDEKCIINYLIFSDLTGLDVLHMGVGNNFIIRSFPTSRVTGTTISILEYQKALSLKIPTYLPILIDKHDPALEKVLGFYDIIVENNIGSYSPDYKSGCKVLEVLLNCLRPNGVLLTHTAGLEYRNPFNLERAMVDINSDRTIHYEMNGVVLIK